MKNKKLAIFINGLVAGILSCTISVLLNYFVFPFPDSVVGNIISHGFGSFFSGFFSAIMAIIIYNYTCRSSLTV
jgi:hypothetical protein